MLRDKRSIAWLYSQEKELTENKILSHNDFNKLREYYGPVPERRHISGLVIFSVIGSVLVGLGIILVIAFNWDKIPHFIKVAISMLPVLLGIALARYAKLKNAAYTEAAAAFWFLSIGATISLISQVYGIHGELEGFILIWLILGFPVIYLMQSSFSYFLFVLFTVWWASLAQINGGNALLFWLFMGAAMPFFVSEFRKDKYSMSTIWLSLITAIAFSIGIGVALEKNVPGLWLIVYTSAFSVLYLASGLIYEDRGSVLQRPLQWYSVLSICSLVLMYTYSWPWENIGIGSYRADTDYNPYAGIVDYALAIILPAASILLLKDAVKADKPWLLDYGMAPVVVTACYFLASSNTGIGVPIVLFVMNIYAAYLAIRAIIAGIRLREMAVINGGMVMFAALILMRYFDLDMGLMERGMAFIVMGILILTANAYISKKVGKK